MDDSQLQTCLDVIDSNKPLGAWDEQPAIAATTVTVENTSPYAMWVVVAGAAAATVKVDGVLCGAVASGTYQWVRVRSGSNIALVYSSTAPTWNWFYE